MCFAPQRRALFRHLNFQKWSEHVVFLTFWLRNVLRATTACNFWPDGSAPAALASLLFDPLEPQIMFRDFPTFSRTCIFFLLTLSSLWSSLFCSSRLFSSLTLTTSAFHLSILSEVWLLNSLRLTTINWYFWPYLQPIIHSGPRSWWMASLVRGRWAEGRWFSAEVLVTSWLLNITMDHGPFINTGFMMIYDSMFLYDDLCLFMMIFDD